MSWRLPLRVGGLAATLLIPFTAGCTPIAAVVAKVAPPAKIEAKYVPKKVPTVVLVENYQNPSSLVIAADRLDRQITEQLREHKVTPVIEETKLFELRSNSAQAYHSMKVEEIGRTLGAAQVLYVNLLDFHLEPALGSEMVKGRAEGRVKLVDAQKGQTMWPSESSGGYAVALETPYIRLGNGITEASVLSQMYESFADQTAKLFYSYREEEKSSEPQ